AATRRADRTPGPPDGRRGAGDHRAGERWTVPGGRHPSTDRVARCARRGAGAVKPLAQIIDPGWATALAPVEPQIRAMGDFLRAQPAYLPAGADVLRAFTYPFDAAEVLIVGQDPYPTPGHPIGLSFAVAPDVRPLPPSLVNIYTELVSDLGVPMPSTGDLRPWAQRGVVLLNRVLTVAPGRSASHRGKGWE